MKFKIYNNSGIYRLDSERGKSRIYEIINKSQPKKIKKLFTKATDVDIPRGCYNFYIKNYTLSFSFIYSGIEYLFDFLHKIINHNISLLVTLEDAGSYIYVVTIPIDDNKVRLIFLDRKETNYRNSQKRYYDTELKNTVVVCDILINKYELVKQFNQEFHKIYDENKYYLSQEYVELCIKNKEKICQEYSLRSFEKYIPILDKYLENPDKYWEDSFFDINNWNVPIYKTVSELQKRFTDWKDKNVFIDSKIEHIFIMGLIFNDDRQYYTFRNGKWYSHIFDIRKRNNIRYQEEEEGPCFNPNKKENVSLTLDEPLSIFFSKEGHLDIDFTKTARFMMEPNSFDFWEKSGIARSLVWKDVSKYFSKNIIGHTVVNVEVSTYSKNEENMDKVSFVMDNGFCLSIETDLMTGYMSLFEEKR